MIIQLEPTITPELQSRLVATLTALKLKLTEVRTQRGGYLVCTNAPAVDIRQIGSLEGVKDVHNVSDNYKLVSRKWKQQTSVIRLGDDVEIGGGTCAMMAGPCSIEGEEQIRAVARHLSEQGVKIMRGGVFKPRSSPYAFRGKGLDGLKLFYSICREHGLYVVTEVMEMAQIEPMYDYVDMYQVGARNSQNFNLLDALGKVDKPVLLKRGISGTIDELLQSAEYIFSGGNEQLALCERGIRSFEPAYRNTFDINAIPVLKQKSHLPVIADPSHGVGIRGYVPAVAMASLAAGADGIIYEVAPVPEEALSDAQQTLSFEESERMLRRLRAIEAAMDR